MFGTSINMKAYKGSEGKTLHQILNEHWKLTTQAVCEQQAETSNSIDWEEVKAIHTVIDVKERGLHRSTDFCTSKTIKAWKDTKKLEFV